MERLPPEPAAPPLGASSLNIAARHQGFGAGERLAPLRECAGRTRAWAEAYAAILGDNEVDVRAVAGTV